MTPLHNNGARDGKSKRHGRNIDHRTGCAVMTAVVNTKGHATVDTPGAQTSDLSHDVTNNWEWQLIVAATEVALGPVCVLIDNTDIDDYSPIKLMREPDYGA
jgi:hypothetical protein